MWIEHIATLGLIPALIALSWYDLTRLRLPDPLTLPMIALGVWTSAVFLGSPVSGLVGAAIGYLFIYGIEVFYLRFRGIEAIGRGDAKLLAAAGAWCGPFYLPVLLLIASGSALLYLGLLGAIRGKMPGATEQIPFGPWLAFGFGLCWLARAYGPGLYPVL